MFVLNKKSIKIIVFLFVFFIIIGIFLFFYPSNENNAEKIQNNTEEIQKEEIEVKKEQVVIPSSKGDLQAKIKDVLNPKSCGPVEVLQANGFISDINSDALSIHQQNNEDITVKITPETLFLEIEINEKGDIIYYQKEITLQDLSQNNSVVVNYFLYRENDNELVARIVKLILLK